MLPSQRGDKQIRGLDDLIHHARELDFFLELNSVSTPLGALFRDSFGFVGDGGEQSPAFEQTVIGAGEEVVGPLFGAQRGDPARVPCCWMGVRDGGERFAYEIIFL